MQSPLEMACAQVERVVHNTLAWSGHAAMRWDNAFHLDCIVMANPARAARGIFAGTP